jgi:hypothetical protein
MSKEDNTLITSLPEGHYFVFGSNEAGRHGKGAALTAKNCFGAVYGQGHGEQGRSYALATKDDSIRSLSLDEIRGNVRIFLQHATNHPHKQWAVSRIGCGLAGYSDEEIAPLFKRHPQNVYFLEKGWKKLM